MPKSEKRYTISITKRLSRRCNKVISEIGDGYGIDYLKPILEMAMENYAFTLVEHSICECVVPVCHSLMYGEITTNLSNIDIEQVRDDFDNLHANMCEPHTKFGELLLSALSDTEESHEYYADAVIYALTAVIEDIEAEMWLDFESLLDHVERGSFGPIELVKVDLLSDVIVIVELD